MNLSIIIFIHIRTHLNISGNRLFFREQNLISKIEYIKLRDVSKDYKFDINALCNMDVLEESIRSHGFLSPLLAWREEDKIILVDGFKRLKIAKNAGINELPFIFLPDSKKLTDIVHIRHHDILLKNPELNILQKTAIYQIIKQSHASKDILNIWQRKLNLSKPERFNKLLSWPVNAREYIYQYNISAKQIIFSLEYNYDQIEEIFNFAELLSIRIVEINKIIEMVNEISLNEQVTVSEILRSENIQSILNNPSYNRNQKIAMIKSILYNWRFPRISQLRSKLQQEIKSLSLPGNINFEFDQTFEKSEIIISARLKNIEDVKKLSTDISNEANLKSFKKVFRLL